MYGKWLNQQQLLRFFISFLSFLVFAQEIFATKALQLPGSAKAAQLVEEAARHYFQKEYQEAIKLLNQAIKKNKKFIPAYLQLAIIYKNLDEPEQSLNLLNQACQYLQGVKAAKKVPLYYEIAALYYQLGAYNQAEIVLEGLGSVKNLSQELYAKIKILEKNLAFALEKIQHPISYTPIKLPLPLNQFTSQYFPILTVDQASLLFTACVDESMAYPENLYISHKDSRGNWSNPVTISEHINTPNSNEGTCAISADKKTLIFTSCARAGNYGTCDLYISCQQDGTWSEPKNLGPHINSTGWQSQPSLSADGKTLYFIAERAGNYGKKDIWKSTLDEYGQWSSSVNLGPPINSTASELAPFIHPNGQTLFFASNRMPSMGGFDLYYANFIGGQWSDPVHLGYPINNHEDQVSIFITVDGKKAYYAGGKQKDVHCYKSQLYELAIPDNLIAMPKSDFIKIQVLDQFTQQPLPAQIELFEIAANNAQATVKTYASDGETIMVVNEGKEYLIHLKQDGYLFETIQVTYKLGGRAIINPSGPVQLKRLALNQAKILQNIYFAFDDYGFDPLSMLELNCLVAFLQTNPQICIALEGHTDDIGITSYNRTLSLKRAQAIYDYLISAGIAANRLTYQGYGAAQPLLLNDTEANRKINRRVAFRITQL